MYVDDASVRLDSTAPPREGDEDATTLRATPTPREEDFQGKSKKKVVEAFAKAEHKSAEAWRQEAMKAQRKLEELSAKGMEDDAEEDGELMSRRTRKAPPQRKRMVFGAGSA